MPSVTSLWAKAVPPGCLLSLRDSDRQDSGAAAYPGLAPVGLTWPKNVFTALLLSEGPQREQRQARSLGDAAGKSANRA